MVWIEKLPNRAALAERDQPFGAIVEVLELDGRGMLATVERKRLVPVGIVAKG